MAARDLEGGDGGKSLRGRAGGRSAVNGPELRRGEKVENRLPLPRSAGAWSPQLQLIFPCSLMELETEVETETIPRKRKGTPNSALETEPDLEIKKPNAKVSKGEPGRRPKSCAAPSPVPPPPVGSLPRDPG